MCCFETFIYCNTVSTTALANSSITSHNYHFFFVVRTLKIQCLNNLEIYMTALLTTIPMLCIRPP